MFFFYRNTPLKAHQKPQGKWATRVVCNIMKCLENQLRKHFIKKQQKKYKKEINMVEKHIFAQKKNKF